MTLVDVPMKLTHDIYFLTADCSHSVNAVLSTGHSVTSLILHVDLV